MPCKYHAKKGLTNCVLIGIIAPDNCWRAIVVTLLLLLQN